MKEIGIKKETLFLKCRESTIVGTCLHKKYKIYNGKNYITVFITRKKLGMKFGSFSFSKKSQKKKKILKKLYGKSKK